MKLWTSSRTLACALLLAVGALVAGCGDENVPSQDILEDSTQDTSGADVIPDDTTPDMTERDTQDAIEPDIDQDATDIVADTPFQYPDAAFINAVRTPPASVVDEPFNQWFTEYFNTTEQLPSLDVRKVATAGDVILLGTAGGLMVKTAEAQDFTPVWPGILNAHRDVVDTVVVDLADYMLDQVAAFVTAHSVILISLDDLSVDSWAVDTVEITAIGVVPQSDSIYLGTKSGLYLLDREASLGQSNAVLTAITGFEEIEIRDIGTTPSDGLLYVGTSSGLYIYEPGNGLTHFTTANSGLPDDDVLSVKMCPGHLAVGTATGFMAAESPQTMATIKADIDGLAWGEVIGIACDQDHFLIGHEMGATLLSTDLSQKDYFYGLRWMVDQVVYDPETEMTHLVGKRLPGVGLDANGDLWLGGPFGLTRIFSEERTLAEKEQVFDSYVNNFWRMGGFFSSDGYTNTPWQPMSEMRLGDKDNDGLWTQMMIGGWCFAYATTGDEKYYDYAHKAMQNMYKLIDYPWISFEAAGKEKGFISRSIISQETDWIPCGGDYVNNGGSGDCPGPGEPCTVPCVDNRMNYYDYKVCCSERVSKTDGTAGVKEGMFRWNPVEVDGKKYVWKADTSSDEIAGHFFGFPIYYDLCAKDDEERQLVASYAATLAGYIADNAMNLIDLDGTMTTFGQFGPDTIGIAVDGLEACADAGHSIEDCMGEYFGGGWLNSNEGLAMLLSAWHMTGDKYFYDVYEDLVTTHKYFNLAIPTNDTLTIVNPSIQNHSDHELATLAYTTVLRYEPNPERLAHWLEGYAFMYENERPERNPWWAAVAALSGYDQPDAENARRTLQELPDDLREWAMDNCHRKDYKLNSAKDRHGDRQFTSVPPYDEIRTFWWNGNPYDCSEGGAGNSWNAPTVFLLPYYMAMYSGLIEPPVAN
ncbi:MAG TPA: hypothetical protein PLY68_00730 [Myxococcota bacterium]|nr:hypothetical protein [Myxococcota bacterium]HQP94703.1 hypothetical protein [Myxococcota bacterium]